MKYLKTYESWVDDSVVSIGDIIVMDQYFYEIIQDMDDDKIWSYEHSTDGGNLAEHDAATFNWWVRYKDDVKVLSVDKFIEEFPEHKKEILNIYLNENNEEDDFGLVREEWSRNENFLIHIESKKFNI